MELTGATATGSNGSKEQIIGGTNDVVVTTDIETQFEEDSGDDQHAGSAHECRVSGDDEGRGPSSDIGKAV